MLLQVMLAVYVAFEKKVITKEIILDLSQL